MPYQKLPEPVRRQYGSRRAVLQATMFYRREKTRALRSGGDDAPALFASYTTDSGDVPSLVLDFREGRYGKRTLAEDSLTSVELTDIVTLNGAEVVGGSLRVAGSDTPNASISDFGFNDGGAGTIFAEGEGSGWAGARFFDAFNDADNFIETYANGASSLSANVRAAATSNFLGGPTLTNDVSYKTALAFAANDLALAEGGVVRDTDASAAIPSGITNIYIGTDQAGSAPIGKIYKLIVWPARISNADLVTETA